MVGDGCRLGERVAVPNGVGARDAVDECVGGLEADSDLDGVGESVTGTHAPHVSPGNPGAPGVAATAVYPSLHPPRYATPHAEYPGGQGAQGGVTPVAYWPMPHPGEEVGEWEAAATSSRRVCGVGDFGGVGVAWGDLLGDDGGEFDLVGEGATELDLEGEVVALGDLVGVSVALGDLVGVVVALGDLEGVIGTHEPQLDAL